MWHVFVSVRERLRLFVVADAAFVCATSSRPGSCKLTNISLERPGKQEESQDHYFTGINKPPSLQLWVFCGFSKTDLCPVSGKEDLGLKGAKPSPLTTLPTKASVNVAEPLPSFFPRPT